MSHSHQSLTDEQRDIAPGEVFPSGEANFYDFSQDALYNGGSGINANFPSPSDFTHDSGTIRTYGSERNPVETTGVFAFDGIGSNFSNASTAGVSGITDFTIFNYYIHNETGVNGPVTIPYLSTYTVASGFDPYAIN